MKVTIADRARAHHDRRRRDSERNRRITGKSRSSRHATPDLNRGVEEIEKSWALELLQAVNTRGVERETPLITLGPATYLEIIAPDPEQPPPKTPRPFGIDGLKESRLVAWAAKGSDLERLRDEAARREARLGK